MRKSQERLETGIGRTRIYFFRHVDATMIAMRFGVESSERGRHEGNQVYCVCGVLRKERVGNVAPGTEVYRPLPFCLKFVHLRFQT